MLKICVFGSGSKGNCTLVSSGTTNLLIDDGLPIRRVEKELARLNVDPYSVSVLITHSHVDHVGGLAAFVSKYDSDVYAEAATYDALVFKYGLPVRKVVAYRLGGDFFVGDVTVSPFKVSHDVPCVGYGLYCNGCKISIATDLGKITDKTINVIGDSDLVMLEFNHDEELLWRNPHYPDYLKARITSDKGHLSNAVACRAAVKLVKSGVKQLILAHLSQENNIPELAYETLKDTFLRSGITIGKDVKVEIARQDASGEVHEIL